jgi:hypothetical protein
MEALVGETTNKYIARGSKKNCCSGGACVHGRWCNCLPVWLTVHKTTKYHEVKNRLGTSYDVSLSFQLLILYGKVNMCSRLQCTRNPRDHLLITSEIVGALSRNLIGTPHWPSETTECQVDVCCIQCWPGDRRSVVLLHSVRISSESHPSSVQWKPLLTSARFPG